MVIFAIGHHDEAVRALLGSSHCFVVSCLGKYHGFNVWERKNAG